MMPSNAAYQREYYLKNRDKRLAYQRAYTEDHKDEIYARNRERYYEHREGRLAHQKAYADAHKTEKSAYDKTRSQPSVPYYQRKGYNLKKYGLTLEQFEALLASQDHKCAVCKEEFTVKFPCVDHDHNTNAVRGLLCSGCNRSIAIFDNPLLLESTLRYLRKDQTL